MTNRSNVHHALHCVPGKRLQKISLQKLRLYGFIGSVLIIFSYLSSFSFTISRNGQERRQAFNKDFLYSNCRKGSKEFKSYCKHVACMHHSINVDDELFLSTTEKYNASSGTRNKGNEEEGCKILWFSSLHESDGLCDVSNVNQYKYNIDYSVALNSAIINANDSLQPVLLLGRYGTDHESSSEHKKLGLWASEKGVKVIYVPRLSFQDDIIRGLPHLKSFSHKQAPFLRMDIPKFIKENNLFDLSNVCKSHVLYTDADVIFANRITKDDMQGLIKSMHNATMSYGREYNKKPSIASTGVMLINVDRFEEEITKILHQARIIQNYPLNDQHMINEYKNKHSSPEKNFQMLPIFYNWKPYWKLQPSSFSQVKILHFHGPKSGQGLDHIANCDLKSLPESFDSYERHISQGICCDQGRVAVLAMKAIKNLKAPMHELCDIKYDSSEKIDDQNAVNGVCHRGDKTFTNYCKQVGCMRHKKTEDSELSLSTENYNVEENNGEGCKTLWFAALHESDSLCDLSKVNEHRYNLDYSVALHSAIENAGDSLQPVLLVGRFGTNDENSIDHKKLGTWASQKGVKVIYANRLSFQDDVLRGLPEKSSFPSHLQGPFLRLDIPKFVKENDLFDMPNVCQNHVLYTDVDIIFANKITKTDIQGLVKSMGNAALSYGREDQKKPSIINTGVMVINVERFEQEIQLVLEQARNEIKFPNHDQDMLNNYQRKQSRPGDKFHMLPMKYNWKAYWELEPTIFSEVKIVHFHGPKLGKGLEGIANCDLNAVSKSPFDEYKRLMNQGICCDGGRTAAWALKSINDLQAPLHDLCG